ncbi:carbohydrate ABC transporter permease [Candidatus Harpocratesius sp.]
MSTITTATQIQVKKTTKRKKSKGTMRSNDLATAYLFLLPALLSIIIFIFLPIFFALIMSLYINPTAGDLGDRLFEFYFNFKNLNNTSFFEFFTYTDTSIFSANGDISYGLFLLVLAIFYLLYINLGYRIFKKKSKLSSPVISLIVLLSGLLVAPFLLWILRFIWNYIPIVIPLENYRVVLTATELDFVQILFNTVFWTVICVCFHVIIGILLAVLMNREFAGKGFFRSIFIIPWAIPSFASTLIWKNFIFNPNGFLGKNTDKIFPKGFFTFNVGNLISIILGALVIFAVLSISINFFELKIIKDKSYRALIRSVFLIIGILLGWLLYYYINPILGGIENNLFSYKIINIEDTTGDSFWINSSVYILNKRFIMITFSAIIINIWLGVPFMMVSFLAAMQGIPPDLYEAAEIDGADAWIQFKSITFPLIKPTLFTVSLLGFVWTFNLFNVVYILAQGQNLPNSRLYSIFVTFIYSLFDESRDYARAAALSFIVFLLLTTFTRAYKKIFNPDKIFIGEEGTLEEKIYNRYIEMSQLEKSEPKETLKEVENHYDKRN